MNHPSSMPRAVDREPWILVAAYNEAPRIGVTLGKLLVHYRRIVVVDDGSSDDTAEAVHRVAQSAPHGHQVWLLRHMINCGQGAALQTAIDFAIARGADFLVTFDADGQHFAEDIEALLAPLREGRVDVALGSRFLGAAPGMPWSRRLVLRLGVLFTRWFSRIQVTDTHNGLRALSRSAATKLRITQNRMAHASEILDEVHRHRLRFVEVPVRVQYTAQSLEKGQSSWNAFKIVSQFLLGRMMR
ncbi:MAG: glycosyltransferase family 2 protein [Planctomycetota bacterium]